MKKPRFVLLVAMLAVIAVVVAACGSDKESEPAAAPEPAVEAAVSEAWVRTGIDPTAIYLTISNPGASTVTLSGVEAEWADEVGLHQTVQRDGLIVMEHMPSITVPAGGTLTFAPGGLHLMAQHLHAPISEGDSLQLALLTESGERIRFTAEARGIDAGASDADDHSEMSHGDTEHDTDEMDDHEGSDVEAHGMVFSSGTIPPGMSFEFTFDQSFEGVMIPYHNHLDATSGSIMVMEGAETAGAVSVTIRESGYAPTDLHISPGTVVTWTNETAVAWTVVSGYHPDHVPSPVQGK